MVEPLRTGDEQVGIVASDKGGADFKPVPAGTHVGICVMVVDLGIQAGGKFKPSRKVYLRWELPHERTEWTDRDGNKHEGPMIIGKQYTLSLSEKANLRADLESWRGKSFTEKELEGFDLVNVLGKPCMIGVTHNVTPKKTYANIGAVMGLSKGMQVPPAHNKPVSYSPDEHDPAVYDTLPDWLKELIEGRQRNDTAPTVNGNGKTVSEEFDDDIPF
jgi:hypothetical protein